ncbi:MAG: prolyl oligopeptidase [Limisphaerales bacterium]|jgi:prolyl oligopeptidase
MENPQNPDLITWLEEQEALKKSYYKKELKSTGYLKERIEALGATEGNRFEKSGPYFFQQLALNERNSASLYISESPRKQGILLVNPYRFSKNGELLSIADYVASPDGKYIAVAFSSHGSDWNTIRIFRPSKGKPLEDEVIHVKAQFNTLTWIGNGFVYARFKSKGLDNKYLNQTKFERLFYHKIGTRQEEDLPLDKEYFKCEASADQNEILLYRLEYYANQSTLYIDRMYLSELESTEINPIPFLSMDIEDQIDFRYIGTFNDGHCFLTNYQAPKYQVLYCDTSLQNNTELMERSDTSVIENAIIFNSKLITLNYYKGEHFVDVIDEEEVIRYPVGKGASVRWKGVDPINNIIFLSVTRYFLPSLDYQLNISTGKVDMVEQLTTSFKFEKYKTNYIEYESKDGTLIPMYLTHKRAWKKMEKHLY